MQGLPRQDTVSSTLFNPSPPAVNFSAPVFGTATVTRRLDYFGTARGRLGFAFDRALIYATGGLAVGGTNLTYSGRIGFPVAPTIFLAGTSSVAKAKIGYTLGGGVEYAVWNNWSVKAEYLITTSVGNRRRSVARSRISPR
jgi:outer membrane immunogenic protein